MNRWLWLTGAIVVEVAATLALRAATEQAAWYLPVVVGYVASFLFLAGALRQGMAIGVAYGIWGASGVVLTAVAAAFLFGEPLTPLMGLGFAVIVAGVLLVELGAHRAEQAPARMGEGR
ncbi:SMR family transporter [Modestobacter sp. VKM Ac-2979]|uniref:DMT family transporter n=1 Tax=unclassified Modestobacter TaxID=2643866 RepID=UPI0022AB9D56|nr:MULTISPECIES: SMR family transporter [unclassified Modestobacter]MCZ2809963.1 SMR family transporter [Modestobacter sp. VKM Ac-2979]MCZ2842622.1 SMR family transporter [Modestobacter sp. VKM Ac-2980]